MKCKAVFFFTFCCVLVVIYKSFSVEGFVDVICPSGPPYQTQVLTEVETVCSEVTCIQVRRSSTASKPSRNFTLRESLHSEGALMRTYLQTESQVEQAGPGHLRVTGVWGSLQISDEALDATELKSLLRRVAVELETAVHVSVAQVVHEGSDDGGHQVFLHHQHPGLQTNDHNLVRAKVRTVQSTLDLKSPI